MTTDLILPGDECDYVGDVAGGVFSLYEFERNAGRFWKLPVSLARNGRLKSMLGSGKARSHGIASSVLPVLALLTWPDTDPVWTKEVCVSLRYVARLAGINKDSARKGIARLQSLGLLRLRKVYVLGRGRLLVRLATSLYANGDERFAMFPAELIFGGGWSLIGSPAARHLLLVILCRQPVLKPEALAKWMAERGRPADIIASEIASKRRTHALSLGRLSQLSGLARSTVQEALRTLCNPLRQATADSLPLLQSGTLVNRTIHLGVQRAQRWYALNETAIKAKAFFPVEKGIGAANTGVSDGENAYTDSLDRSAPIFGTGFTDVSDGLHRYSGHY